MTSALAHLKNEDYNSYGPMSYLPANEPYLQAQVPSGATAVYPMTASMPQHSIFPMTQNVVAQSVSYPAATQPPPTMNSPATYPVTTQATASSYPTTYYPTPAPQNPVATSAMYPSNYQSYMPTSAVQLPYGDDTFARYPSAGNNQMAAFASFPFSQAELATYYQNYMAAVQQPHNNNNPQSINPTTANGTLPNMLPQNLPSPADIKPLNRVGAPKSTNPAKKKGTCGC